ncbi:MAG: hypothetical protein HY843_06135 [Bdellovibrio sp.]|nr:hypothetical protein [Bdellovibrio sp.]
MVTHQSKVLRLLSKLIVFVLIVQFVVPVQYFPVVYAADDVSVPDAGGGGAVDPSIEESGKIVNDALTELADAKPGELPKESPDTFKLTGQELHIFGADGKVEKRIDLGNLNLDISSKQIGNFERDVKVILDPGTSSIIFELTEKGALKARHIVSGITPIAFARDKELLVILDASGVLHATDMAFVRESLFTSPIPLVKLVDSGLKPNEVQGVQLSFLTRGLAPYTRGLAPYHDEGASVEGAVIQPIDKPLTAGDIIITKTKEDGKSVKIGGIDRSVMQTQVSTAMGVLSFLAHIVAPSKDSEDLLPEIYKLQKKEVADASAKELSQELPSDLRGALSVISNRQMAALLARANRNMHATGENRDQFSYSEWEASFQSLRRQAQIEVLNALGDATPVELRELSSLSPDELSVRLHERQEQMAKGTLKEPADPNVRNYIAELEKGLETGDLGSVWRKLHSALIKANGTQETRRSLLYRVLTSKRMKLLGKIAVGGAALAGVYSALPSEQAAWVVHTIQQIYDSYWPSVLKDKAYRITLLKSTLGLLAFIPALYLLGAAKVKLQNLPDWTPVKGLVSVGKRIYAELMLPFWHRVLGWTNHPNFIRACQNGVNPFTRVAMPSVASDATSLEPRVGSGSDPAGLTILLTRKERIRSLALLLAYQVASREAEIDAEALDALSKERGFRITGEELEKRVNDKNFQRRWAEVASELNDQIERLGQSRGVKDFTVLSTEELRAFYAEAKKIADAVKTRGPVGRFAAKTRQKCRTALSRVLSGLGRFGLAEYEFLRRNDPSEFVTTQTWQQFVMDYSFTVMQMALVGARANPGDQQALAANEDSFFWTTPGHRYDMFEQVWIYGVSVPGRMMLIYQRLAQMVEDNYAPIEAISLQGQTREDGFFSGVLGWTLNAINLRKANYGPIILNRLIRSIKTIQAAILTNIAFRVFFGGQNILTAAQAFVYSFLVGYWVFGWMWEPITRGNQLYGEAFDEMNSEFMTIKTELGQALRTGNAAGIVASYKKLIQLFKKDTDNSLELPYELSDKELEKTLDAEAVKVLREFYSSASQGFAAVGRLQEAIQLGDQERLERARQELLNIHISIDPQSPALKLHANAAALLEYSLEHPPIVNAPNGLISWGSNLLGSLLTTYAAGYLNVFTFRPNIPWGEKIGEAAVLSTILYTSTILGQKGLNAVVDYVKERRAQKIAGRMAGAACERMLVN